MLRPPPPTPGDAPAPLAQLRSMREGGAAAPARNSRKHLDAVRASTSPLGTRSKSPSQLALKAQNLKVAEPGSSPLAPTLANRPKKYEQATDIGEAPPTTRLRPPPPKSIAGYHPPQNIERRLSTKESIEEKLALARLAKADSLEQKLGRQRSARDALEKKLKEQQKDATPPKATAPQERRPADDMDIKTDTPQERRQRRSTVDALPVIATPTSPRDGDVDMKSPNQPSPPNQPPNQPPVKSRAARMEAANLRGEVFDLQGGKALNLRDNQKSPVPPPASQTAAVSVETLADAWQDSIPDGESWAADQRISTAMLEYSRQTRRNSKDLSEGAHALAIERANAAAAKAEAEAKKADAAAAAAAAPTSAPEEGRKRKAFGFEAVLRAKVAEAALAKAEEASKAAPAGARLGGQALWLKAGQLMERQIAMRAGEGMKFRDTIKALHQAVATVQATINVQPVIAGWAQAQNVGALLDAADAAVCEQLKAVGANAERRRSLALPQGARARWVAVGDRLIEERVRVNARMHLFSLKQNLDLLLRRYAEKAIAEASADDWAKMRSHDGLDAAEATLQTLETMLKKRHQSIVIDMWVGSTTSA